MFHEKNSIPKNTGIDIANTGIIPDAVLDFFNTELETLKFGKLHLFIIHRDLS
jgi:hypothetical protein